ncbi:hypothetical protein [Nostoc sp. MG11]|uniref:hypothetical protein n=1 Tax=Nostoc sp. MG11 TaxID=2721166 RepID=UPI0018670603|nr:hypothetical protein [Nostoc sp. MG11]
MVSVRKGAVIGNWGDSQISDFKEVGNLNVRLSRRPYYLLLSLAAIASSRTKTLGQVVYAKNTR